MNFSRIPGVTILSLIAGLVCAMAAFAGAEPPRSPRAQLKESIAQLQNDPDNLSLREKIIELTRKIMPLPAVPEEARRHFVKAGTLLKEAKTPEDYDMPIREYRQALLLAPWWADAYYNLASTLELKGQYAGAIENLKLSILSNPQSPDVRATQDKIYSLEAKAEKKSAEESSGAAKARFFSSLDGGIWKESRHTQQIEHGQIVEMGTSEDSIEIHGNHLKRYHTFPNGRRVEQADAVISDRKVDWPGKPSDMSTYEFTIADDGATITLDIEENTLLIPGNSNGFSSLITQMVYQRVK